MLEDTKEQTIEIRNRNHFDIILDLGKPDEELGRNVIKMIRDEKEIYTVVINGVVEHQNNIINTTKIILCNKKRDQRGV